MFTNRKSLSLIVPAMVGLGLTGAALASVGSSASEGPLRCEIRTTTQGALVSLQGVVETDAAIGGTYRFTVESAGGSGSSAIRQGGAFLAAPGQPTMLGQVMLGAGQIYDARLELSAGRESATCEERIGGSL